MEKEEDVRRLGGGWKESDIVMVMMMMMTKRKMEGRCSCEKVW